MAQEFLRKARIDRVTVYHMFTDPRGTVSSCFALVGGFSNDKSRDEAMTQNSNHDIVWIKPGREKSDTAKNVKRRAKQQ